MFYVAVTRFDTGTWNENCRWRDRENATGCAYGSPRRITDRVEPTDWLYVIEMNNSSNKIMGVGLIRAMPSPKKSKMYKEGNYNRFFYIGPLRTDRSQIKSPKLELLFDVLDVLLFKGKRHFKRGQGIELLPDWIRDSSHLDLQSSLKVLFENAWKRKGGLPVIGSQVSLSFKMPVEAGCIELDSGNSRAVCAPDTVKQVVAQRCQSEKRR